MQPRRNRHCRLPDSGSASAPSRRPPAPSDAWYRGSSHPPVPERGGRSREVWLSSSFVAPMYVSATSRTWYVVFAGAVMQPRLRVRDSHPTKVVFPYTPAILRFSVTAPDTHGLVAPTGRPCLLSHGKSGSVPCFGLCSGCIALLVPVVLAPGYQRFV